MFFTKKTAARMPVLVPATMSIARDPRGITRVMQKTSSWRPPSVELQIDLAGTAAQYRFLPTIVSWWRLTTSLLLVGAGVTMMLRGRSDAFVLVFVGVASFAMHWFRAETEVKWLLQTTELERHP